MAKVFRSICLEDYTITDQGGAAFTLRRGQEYLTSMEWQDGTVTVFSTYWVRVPARIFGGSLKFC